ncbi:MAG: hemerythrin domain-containing protein [Anaerolineae bacterium]
MKPTEELKTEHRAIERMLRILEGVSERLESGGPVDPKHLAQIVEFIQVFADRCHHGKEEDLLFVAMAEAGIPTEGGPIGVMLREHVVGRGHVATMNRAAKQYAAGNDQGAEEFAAAAREYAKLLRQHIAKEDNILYPMADRALSQDKQRELLEEFEVVEQERVGPGRHEAFHKLLDGLEQTYVVG